MNTHALTLIVAHIENQLSRIDTRIDDRDKKLVLVAALLHDIGHGPFSHAFEKVQIEPIKSHEEWTSEIIENTEGELNKTLIKHYDAEFPKDVSSLIKKGIRSKEDGIYFEKIDLHHILSSLVSSQLDADRLDYLVRDSTFTGVTFGKIDIDRIISAIRVTEHENKYCICFQEKYISDLESYLLARFQMSKGVYYHSFKVEMETIIQYIFRRSRELYNSGQLNFIPKTLIPFFENKLTINDYLQLDDSVLTSAFISWKNEPDEIIKKLCHCFIDRKKFKKLDILMNTDENVTSFKGELNEIYNEQYGKNIKYESDYFWIEENIKYSMYNTSKENIKILCKSGKIKDISEVSHIFKREKGKLNNEEYTLCFISEELLPPSIYQEPLACKLRDLINAYDIKNHIEIERKYSINGELDISTLSQTITKIKDVSILEVVNSKVQIDSYYDTNDSQLKNAGESLRIRNIGDKNHITIKAKYKTDESTVLNEQHERIEYEKIINDPTIKGNIDYINKKLSTAIVGGLEIIATIKNKRSRLLVEFKGAKLEVCLDEFDVIEDDNVLATEKQLEIELKSDYATKIQLKQFGDLLVSKLPALAITNKSKLEIALSKCGKQSQ
jgi:HD superfamily phosphohydrolase/uncharacterized protein YjbK